MSDYEDRLSKWAANHGVVPHQPGSIEEAEAKDAALKACDKRMPGDDYCVICGHGPQPISGMMLITRRDDPYTQIDDMDDDGGDDDVAKEENRVRACPKCFEEEYGPDDEEAGQGNGGAA